MRGVAVFGVGFGICGVIVCVCQVAVPAVPFAVFLLLMLVSAAYLYEHAGVDLLGDGDEVAAEIRQLRDDRE